MSKGDLLVERGAARLESLSRKVAARGGYAANFADELAEDAAFLRKLKPSLIKARAQGKVPTDGKSPINRVPREPPATSAAQVSASRLPKRRRAKRRRKRTAGGPNPFLIAGVALAAGIVLAKVIDWRGDAHPRD